MSTALVSLGGGMDTVAVAAVAGKIIRLRRIISEPAATITLKSGSTAICPQLKCGSSGNIDRSWPDGEMACQRGESLTIQNHGTLVIKVWIHYEVVD